MNNFKSDKRGGYYWIEEKPYLSVTQILSVISKPALTYWFGKQVYLAMIVDPTLKEAEAMSAPYKVSDTAKTRGTSIHSVVEAYKKGSVINLEGVPEALQGFTKAFYRAMEEIHIDFLEREKTVFSKKHKVAGTLDILAKVDGRVYVLDIKTGKDIYQEAFLQTSAYKSMVEEEGQKVDGIGVLLLKEDGSYKFETRIDVEAETKAFFACKTLYEGLHKEDLEKIGYGKEANESNGNKEDRQSDLTI